MLVFIFLFNDTDSSTTFLQNSFLNKQLTGSTIVNDLFWQKGGRLGGIYLLSTAEIF